MTTTSPLDQRVFLAAVGLSLLAAVVNIAGVFLDSELMMLARWLYVPPLVVALAAARRLRQARGWWWLAGLVLSWVGDTQGGHGFLVLLGAFFVAHVCYVVALWPTRRASWLGRRRSLVHLGLLVVALGVLVPRVDGALVLPVVAYAALLTLMALLATAAGPLGTAGGLLFLVSDLVLALGRFAIELPAATSALVVIGTYVPAQVLLLLAVVRLTGARQPADRRRGVDTAA